MIKRFLKVSLTSICTFNAALSNTPSEIHAEVEAFYDLTLAQGAQRGDKTIGRFDLVATEQQLLPLSYRLLAKLDGFNASVYRDRYSGESKIVYLGTNSKQDWIFANIPQSAGFITSQHNILASAMAVAASEKFRVTSCIGYSLGAATATIGCSVVGLPVVTANGARLNGYNTDGIDAGSVRNYRTGNDPVSGLPFGSLVGKTVVLPLAPGWNPIGWHGIDAVVAAGRERALNFERMMLSRPSPSGQASPTPAPGQAATRGWVCVQADGSVVTSAAGEIVVVPGANRPTHYCPNWIPMPDVPSGNAWDRAAAPADTCPPNLQAFDRGPATVQQCMSIDRAGQLNGPSQEALICRCLMKVSMGNARNIESSRPQNPVRPNAVTPTLNSQQPRTTQSNQYSSNELCSPRDGVCVDSRDVNGRLDFRGGCFRRPDGSCATVTRTFAPTGVITR